MDCPLPYQIKDDYYIDVNDFAEDFIKFSNTLGIDDLSQMLELLLIGVYWEVYKKAALNEISFNAAYKILIIQLIQLLLDKH